MASSRVGATIRARGPGFPGLMCSSSGIRYARVLPLPVGDCMTTSRPSSRAGIDSDWTRLGAVMFWRVRAARTRALTAPSANVFKTKAPGCLSFLLICRDLLGSVWYRKRGPERATHRCVPASVRVSPRPRRAGDTNQSAALGAGGDFVWWAGASAHRFLHERADPCLIGGGQLRQSVGVRPHVAFVELRLVAEAERRVPRLELLRALEEADDLAVLGIGGHPVPGCRREGRRAGFDDCMDPLRYGAIWFRQLGDLREQVAFPFRLSPGTLSFVDPVPPPCFFLGP